MHTPWSLALAALVASAVQAQDVRINEVLCAHGTNGADWIELYNASPRTLDLQGYTIALNGAAHRITAALPLPAKGFRRLWCDRRPADGPDHLDLKLPRTGGTALLIAPDRTSVLDLFTWPPLPDEVSIGRMQDGQRAWGFFERPTPGASNGQAPAALCCLRAPEVHAENGRIVIIGPAGAEVRYTLDGSAPTPSSMRYDGSLTADTAVLRARAFAAGAIPSGEAVHVPSDGRPGLALVVDPRDLWDPAVGLLADNDAANFTRTGPDWTRPAWIAWGGDSTQTAQPVGIAVSGSGSRGRPKKNFKLYARDRFGSLAPFRLADGTTNTELMLRADATPDAFLRNRFMEAIAARSGGHVDVQPSEALPLSLNGRYWGLYRAMPAKNAAWLEQRSGAQAIDVVDGPGGHVLHGKAAGHARMVDAVMAGAPLDTLAALIDLGSLIELACFDLWTGRADHDLNVRCWRPRTPEGRWRWILYDMDLWAPVKDRTVERMCSAAAPETPYLPQLLAHPALRDRLLARMSALLATTLNADRALPLADSLFQAHAAWMQADHARWQAEMPLPAPAESQAGLRAHIAGRSGPLLDQLARRTGRAVHPVTVAVEPAQGGHVLVEDLPLTDDRRSMQGFARAPLRLTAVPAPGMEFAGWKGGEANGATTIVDPAKARSVTARFRPVGVSRQDGLQQRGE